MFLEDLDRSLNDIPEAPRRYRGDTGHTFKTVKFRGAPGTTTITSKDGKTRTLYRGFPSQAMAPSFMGLYGTSSSTTNTAPQWPNGDSIPLWDIQSRIDSLVPRNAGLGETIVELVSGNIPGILTSLRGLIVAAQRNAGRPRVRSYKGTTDYNDAVALAKRLGGFPPWLKRVSRSTGKDYLEYQFGLVPLIKSILDAIEALVKVTDGLYGDSFRRKTGGVHPALDFSVSNSYTGLRNADLHPGYPIRAGLTGVSKISAPHSPFSQDLRGSIDFRLSLRATVNGRPTGALARYYTETPDIIRDLGLWYPSMGWDLIPYSWLVDWVTHLGSAIERSSFFSTTGAYPIDYAYVTFKSKCAVVRTINVPRIVVSGVTYESTGGVSHTTGLYRTRVDPFGFARPLGTLSSFQYSILIALGLAKNR